MKKGFVFSGLAVVLSLVAIMALSFPGAAAAEDTRIIRIYADTTSGFTGRIEPKDIWVKPHTVIVWNNWGKTEVGITFKNGKECDDATVSAMNFTVEPGSGCLITQQYIPYGGTASLKFDKPGKYEYEVNFIERRVTETGVIIVRGE